MRRLVASSISGWTHIIFRRLKLLKLWPLPSSHCPCAISIAVFQHYHHHIICRAGEVVMDRCCNWPLILLMWHSDFLQFDVQVTCQLRLHGQYHQNVANYHWNTLHPPNSSNNNNTPAHIWNLDQEVGSH